MHGYLRMAVTNPKGFRKAVSNRLERHQQVKELLRQARNAPVPPPIPNAVDDELLPERLLEALAEKFAILELRNELGLLHIGVRNDDVLPILQWLKRSFPKIALDPFDTASCRDFLTKPVIEVPLPGGTGGGMTLMMVEPYRMDASARWQSGNANNRILRRCYNQEFDKPGLTRAIDVLGAPTLLQQQDTQPVDVVVTWVNHEDADWQAMYRDYYPDEAGNPSFGSGDALSMLRFHNNDELRYALRSVWQNLPWVNHVHIFSNCRPPAWLQANHPRISWVYHEEVIPARYLPTFNSHVIESFLHHLPDLTEHFIYMNDDFFVMNRKDRSDFFNLAGQSLARLEGYGVVAGPTRPEEPDYLNAARHGQALLREQMGFAATELHSHAPYVLTRSIMAEIEAQFADPISRFRSNRFRALGDLNIPSFFYHHYAMAIGKALPSPPSALLVKCDSLAWPSRLAQADEKRHDFVCINEGGTEDHPAGWHEAVRGHLGRWFPHPAPWENL